MDLRKKWKIISAKAKKNSMWFSKEELLYNGYDCDGKENGIF